MNCINIHMVIPDVQHSRIREYLDHATFGRSALRIRLLIERVAAGLRLMYGGDRKTLARRFKSHSQGAGRVSSKSLMSKMRLPLGRGECAEIHQVTIAAGLRQTPVFGVHDRSDAITAADPRKNANAEVSMRP